MREELECRSVNVIGRVNLLLVDIWAGNVLHLPDVDVDLTLILPQILIIDENAIMTRKENTEDQKVAILEIAHIGVALQTRETEIENIVVEEAIQINAKNAITDHDQPQSNNIKISHYF